MRTGIIRRTLAAALLPFTLGLSAPLPAAEAPGVRPMPRLQAPPRTLQRPPAQQEQQQPQGGAGVYVMDDVDFHPTGGGAIPGLGFNNQVPVSGYYHYSDNSYVIVSGTVHGDGLISGPGQDDWTFVVKLDTTLITGGRPAGCQFAAHRRAQTDAAATAWKYQIMIVFHDTKTKPECYQYFQSLADKPFPVKLIDIVGPYWSGPKTYQEPKLRYYHTGPMLSVGANHAAGHTAQPWSGPLP